MDPSHDIPPSHGIKTPGSNDAAAARDPRAVVPFVPSENAASSARPAESIGSWLARNGPYVVVDNPTVAPEAAVLVIRITEYCWEATATVAAGTLLASPVL